MGAANPFARVKRVKVAQRQTKDALTTAIQERRRNSLAYYTKKYVDLRGTDPTELLREVDTAEKAKLGPQAKKVTIKKVPKFTRVGMKVLHGNFRELKTQVVMHITTINHKYKDAAHFNSTLLHFVCQEGYLVRFGGTLEGDPPSHASFSISSPSPPQADAGVHAGPAEPPRDRQGPGARVGFDQRQGPHAADFVFHAAGVVVPRAKVRHRPGDRGAAVGED